MRPDRFGAVMGNRRGSVRPSEENATPWWLWPPPHYPRLSKWLAHVAAAGYRELALIDNGPGVMALLRATGSERADGYAALEVDSGEAAWLDDHWPRELVVERHDGGVSGRLLP